MIRTAIIGAGIGREHLEGYLDLPHQFAVTWICDLNLARAEEIADPHGIQVARNLANVLADPDVDLVDICLPPHLHYKAAKAALKAGKHVVCEKPMVPSLAEAESLIATAQAAGRVLSPVFQYRYGPAMAQIEALRTAGLLGRPYAASVETHWNRGPDYYATSWRGTWAGENGGAVLGHAIHNHDLLTALLGPVREVQATVATRVNAIETEDCAAIALRFESGALATSSITLGAATDTTRIRICWEGVTAESGTEPYAPMAQPWTFTARAPVEQSQVDDVLAGVRPSRTRFAGYFEALADRLQGREAQAVTPEDGRRSVELVAAIYNAARTGQAEYLPLAEDHPLYYGWAPEPGAVELVRDRDDSGRSDR
ncbi:Gfo/Idh/MocA family protein [Tropicimonas isoalkanivorans]|uniref:Predicted dehydrogenase n=1 Tax=Tropicimonas isoalkanivorans TaxID=441112 RepID=A0A1I1DP19_9RHOB|nr:Gfo/Idh/MocA family oxidoreductase [Tropicimonas isoalkanivorans]SFB76584.1 Predicted dehydrogenase [Tropicimonas isoalkanivorans]